MKTLEVIKIGGSIANDEAKLVSFLQNFTRIDPPKILVHGGGDMASELSTRLDIPIKMESGRRITDDPSLEVAVMVYAGLINKRIVAQLQKLSVNALGLSGADLNIIPAHKRNHPEIDFGLVGDIDLEDINRYFIMRLLDEQIVPVFSAITHDNEGQLLNTNADTIAATLAAAMANEYKVKLTYCFGKQGVLIDPEDEDSWIETLDHNQFTKLIEQEIIDEGMIPKLENAFFALREDVERVDLKHSDNLLTTLGTRVIL